MDACSIRDKQGNPIVEDGYLSFICEESDNIVRVDPNQFDFTGSEPYLMEHGGVNYKLYLYKNPSEGDCEIGPDDIQNELTHNNSCGSEDESAIGAKEKMQVWNKENTDLLMDLYQEIGDSISFTFHPEKKIWEKISEELQSRGFELSPAQVENKIKTIDIEHQIKLNQAQRLQLERIKQEPKVEQNINNRQVKHIFQANENTVCVKPNTIEHLQIKNEPVLFANSEDTQELMATGDDTKFTECCENRPSQNNRILNQYRKKIGWSKESTELLLDFYQLYSAELGKVGKFTSKTQLWCKISEDFKSLGYGFSPIQVQSRWRNLNVRRNKMQQYAKKNRSVECFKENESQGKLEENCDDLPSKSLGVLPAREEKGKIDSKSNLMEDSKVSFNKDSSKAVWSEEQAELLIDVYKEITQNHNLLKFGSKKFIWKKIAQELRNRGQNFTPQQVHSKWKSLQRSLRAKLEKLKKSKLHQVPSTTSYGFNPDKQPESDPGQVFTPTGAKLFGLPLEVVLKDSSDEDSESLLQSCSMFASDDAKSISESLNKLTSIKEIYYKDRILLKEKKLKAFEERTVEIRKTNDLLKQFLNK